MSLPAHMKFLYFQAQKVQNCPYTSKPIALLVTRVCFLSSIQLGLPACKTYHFQWLMIFSGTENTHRMRERETEIEQKRHNPLTC